MGFGLFAGLMVITNYILVITYYFGVACIYDHLLDHGPKFMREKRHENEKEMQIRGNNNNNNNNDDDDDDDDDDDEIAKERLRKPEWVLGRVYAPLVFKGRYIIVFLYICLIGICIGFSTQLKSKSLDSIGGFPDNSNLERFQRANTHFLATQNTGATTIDFVFGISGINRKTADTTIEYLGDVIYDENFNAFDHQVKKRKKREVVSIFHFFLIFL